MNQIRLWVRQGRTDAWIAHKLDVSSDQLTRFKRDHDLEEGASAPARPADPLSVPPPEPEPEAEPEPEPEAEAEPEPEPEQEPDVEEAEETSMGPPPLDFTAVEPVELETVEDEEEEEEEPEPRATARAAAEDRPERGGSDRERPAGAPGRSRRRGRRGGRRRRPRPRSYEATFDHGEEGYGLWLDPAVVDNPVYAEHWAGRRAVVVTLDRDAITIRPAEDDGADGADEPSSRP